MTDAHRRRPRDRSGARPRRHRRRLDRRRPHRRGAAGRNRADETYDAAGKIVMAGAIDIHSHIAGGNVNTARLLLPEFHRAAAARPAATPLSNAGWSTFATGCLYAQMGFTTVVEPAVLPHYALHAHLELADIPIIDKATLAVLGNDDFLLGLLRGARGAAAVRDYVAWTLDATRALGIKVINAGGSMALQGERAPVRARRRRAALRRVLARDRQGAAARRARARRAASAARPLQQSRPGRQRRHARSRRSRRPRGCRCISRICSSTATARRAPRGFSSAAARLAEAVNGAKERHHRRRPGDVRPDRHDLVRHAAPVQRAPSGAPAQMGDPRRRGNGGGIVPYEYRAGDFYNAVQWAVGSSCSC